MENRFNSVYEKYTGKNLSSSFGRRHREPYTPKSLSIDDLILIDVEAEKKARSIYKNYRSTGKVRCSATDFISSGKAETAFSGIKDSCDNLKRYFKRTDKYDPTIAMEVRSISTRNGYDRSSSRDCIIASKLEHIDELKGNMSKDVFFHRAKFQMAHAATEYSNNKLRNSRS